MTVPEPEGESAIRSYRKKGLVLVAIFGAMFLAGIALAITGWNAGPGLAGGSLVGILWGLGLMHKARKAQRDEPIYIEDDPEGG